MTTFWRTTALTTASTGPSLPIAGPPPLDAARGLHSNRRRAYNRHIQDGTQVADPQALKAR
jgi:hypothetical protein